MSTTAPVRVKKPFDPAQHPTPSERTAARPSSGYLPTLDGWRAIAILWVIDEHFGRAFGPITGYISSGGAQGVQIFFALSGLLICTRLLREERSSGAISLKSFYLRRFFRIQPPAFVYLAFIALLSLLHVIPSFWRGILGGALMVRNLWPGEAGGHAYWYTSHFWSLAVEEHFYLLLPALLIFVRRYRLRVFLLALVALNLWKADAMQTPKLQHFGWQIYLRTDVNFPTIMMGTAVAVALTRPQFRRFLERWCRPWVALLYTAFVGTFFVVHLRRLHDEMFTTVYPVLLCSTMLHPEAFFSRLLELRPVRFIGRISYSLYLWQQFWMWPPDFAPEIWIHKYPWLCLPLIFVCATASYYFVEIPLIRLGHRIAKRYEHPRPTATPQAPAHL